MSAGFQELSTTHLTNELENVAVPLLVEQLRTRVAGHCMRVSDLDTELMVRLCARLRAELPNTTVVVLTDGKLSIPAEIAAGEFGTLHGWLKQHVYQYGRIYTAPELIERTTGAPLSLDPYLRYLTGKYGELYKL